MAGLDSMTVRDAIFGLRATRIFRDDPIPEPVLHEVLEAATMACSSGNTQPWEFIVVRDAATKRAEPAAQRPVPPGPITARVAPGLGGLRLPRRVGAGLLHLDGRVHGRQ